MNANETSVQIWLLNLIFRLLSGLGRALGRGDLHLRVLYALGSEPSSAPRPSAHLCLVLIEALCTCTHMGLGPSRGDCGVVRLSSEQSRLKAACAADSHASNIP